MMVGVTKGEVEIEVISFLFENIGDYGGKFFWKIERCFFDARIVRRKDNDAFLTV